MAATTRTQKRATKPAKAAAKKPTKKPARDATRDSLFGDPGKLADVAKWIAGGFALLGGLLTFFGIEGGRLEQILRADPREALIAFLFVGLAVLLGATAPMLNPKFNWPLSTVFLTVMGLFLTAYFLFPDVKPDDTELGDAVGIVIAVVLLGAATYCHFRDVAVPVVVASLLVALAALTLGVYGAVKISVSSTSFAEQPSATVTDVTGTGVERKVTIKVRGGNLASDHYLLLTMMSEKTAASLGEARLVPDGSGTVDESVVFPVPSRKLRNVTVGLADCGQEPCTTATRAVLDLSTPAATTPTT